MKEKRRPLVAPDLLAIGAVVVALDQIAKYATVRYFADKNPYHAVEILGTWLRYIYVENRGAAFGLLQGQLPLFVLTAIIVVPAVFYFYRSLTNEPWFVRLSLGLLLGGTLGNFIDRVRQGYVVDFLDMGIGSTRWPTYNLADASFVIGTVILGLYVLFLQNESPQEQQAGDATPRN